MSKYRVWKCKLVISKRELPNGFDSIPRLAVIKAVASKGFEILGCFSGWGGKLTDIEKELIYE